MIKRIITLCPDCEGAGYLLFAEGEYATYCHCDNGYVEIEVEVEVEKEEKK